MEDRRLLRAAVLWIAAAAMPVTVAACGPLDPNDAVKNPGPINGTFAVSDYFIPSGHMGDGQNLGYLHADTNLDCKPRPPGVRGYCYDFTYLKIGPIKWAGVYWVYPANNWGSRAGRRVENSKAFKQVRFYAASDIPDLRVSFFYGGISDALLPNHDDISDFTAFDVSTEWRQFRMVLPPEGLDFSRLIGAFGWSVAYPNGEASSKNVYPAGDRPFHIYLNDIVWDTEAPPPPPPQP